MTQDYLIFAGIVVLGYALLEVWVCRHMRSLHMPRSTVPLSRRMALFVLLLLLTFGGWWVEQSGEALVTARLTQIAWLSLVMLTLFAVYAYVCCQTALRTLQRRQEEVQASKKRIKFQAYHDALTGLPNRLLFQERLVEALDSAGGTGQMAVLFLDLDRFKIVNDSLGHKAGDLLLQEVARRLQRCVRDGDTVARLGGDEFVLLLPDLAGTEAAVKVAERVAAALEEPVTVDGHELFVSTSIGIALCPQDGDEAETLLKRADTAMYRAKELGVHYQLYTSEMHEAAMQRLSMESAMRKAFERDEFRVYYQPKIDVKTQQLVGIEALVRWQHPEHGLLLPARFIPLAEETGMILPLGEWVLRTACAQMAAWQEQGFPNVRVAVNISNRQFQQRDLPEMVERVLEETGLSAQHVELELTESCIMQSPEQAIVQLEELKRRGVRLSIDDFGTGYSSLNYLRRFPVDSLKISREFIRDVLTHQGDAAIVHAVIHLAHNLSLKVIAEGVEMEEQYAFLHREECDEIQGFLFAPPLPAEEFRAGGANPVNCGTFYQKESRGRE